MYGHYIKWETIFDHEVNVVLEENAFHGISILIEMVHWGISVHSKFMSIVVECDKEEVKERLE